MTDWTAVVLVVHQDEVDEVSGLVWDLGVSGVEELALANGSIELRIGCEATLAELVVKTLSDRWAVRAESVAADTGLDTWREHAQVWRAGSNIVIVPPWLDAPPDVTADDLVLLIDPGHAFGSASHETTRLCLEAVAEFVTPGAVVADIGCGSGVLAVAAVRLGAREAIATDISPEAIIATIENARRNDVADVVDVSTATIEELDSATYDLVLANIGAATLCSMAQGLVQITKPHGVLVLSGLLAEQIEVVGGALKEAGAVIDDVREDGEWRALVAHRS
ncbi:MAG: 50S ribosomal protein L11 methyltransferase [Acidimicrobiia bacterium]|nr:50S ribosomal protein L11 methyltransferase [Acidimicrobiia bacterium]